MDAAVIGALRVDLGLNSAKFTTGLKNASRGADRFVSVIKTSLTRVTIASAAAFAGLGAAVAIATRNIANLSAEAKTAGIAFDEFQKLKYAAEQNLVSIEALTDGLKEMNLRADEFVGTGGGSAAEAFERLGFTVDDLAVKLQNPSDLFTEIIGKLSQLDTAAQIRISDEIFGGTGGEQFVRLLGDGAEGLERLKQEAQDLGLVVGGQAAVNAEKFSAAMARMHAVLNGLANKIAEAVLPHLGSLIDTLSSPGFASSMQAFAVMAINVANGIATAFITAHQAFKDFVAFVDPVVSEYSGGSAQGAFPVQYQEALDEATRNLELMDRGLGTSFSVEAFKDFPFEQFSALNGIDLGLPTTGMDALSEAMSAANDNTIDLISGMDGVGVSAEQMAIQTAKGAATVFGSLASLSASLSSAFEGNKALSVATAVLKGSESIASSFSAGAAIGGPPVGAIYAGIAAITAAANVSAVMSVNQGSTTVPSAGSSGAAVPTGAPAATPQAVTVVMQSQTGSYFGADIEQLIEQLNEAIGDGVNLNVQFD